MLAHYANTGKETLSPFIQVCVSKRFRKLVYTHHITLPQLVVRVVLYDVAYDASSYPWFPVITGTDRIGNVKTISLHKIKILTLTLTLT